LKIIQKNTRLRIFVTKAQIRIMTFTIFVSSSVTEKSDCQKLLGVTVDCSRNFSNHISNIRVKASQRIGVIRRLRN